MKCDNIKIYQYLKFYYNIYISISIIIINCKMNKLIHIYNMFLLLKKNQNLFKIMISNIFLIYNIY
jgi:hypothetical protein